LPISFLDSPRRRVPTLSPATAVSVNKITPPSDHLPKQHYHSTILFCYFQPKIPRTHRKGYCHVIVGTFFTQIFLTLSEGIDRTCDTLRFLLGSCIHNPPFAKTHFQLKQFALWRKLARTSLRKPRYCHFIPVFSACQLFP